MNGQCVSYGGAEVAITRTGKTLRCQSGCRVCIASQANTEATICILAKQGRSLVGGQIRVCASSCKTCDGSSSSVCTSCYPGTTLSGGACVSCTDANALTCSSLNVSFSLTCRRGFTAVAFSGFTTGLCNQCSLFCSSCNTAGPGNCDSNGCDVGAVQIQGTTNCSLCFSGCLVCSATDPTSCTSCGPKRYLSGTLCQKCNTGCKTCTINATNCQSCTAGFFLVGGSSCVAVPSNCASMNSTGCTACIGGYLLDTNLNTCNPDISCNSNNTCFFCPLGFAHQTSFTCLACTLPSNCINCESTNTSLCS